MKLHGKISKAAAGVVLLISGCTVGPNYSAPQPTLPAVFHEADINTPGTKPKSETVVGMDPVERWWLTFRDPELASLVARAIAQNRDLKIAASRIRQARIERVLTGGNEYPTVNATGSFYRGRGSNNVEIPFGSGSSSSGSTASSTTGGHTTPNGSHALAESGPSDSSGANTAAASGQTGKPPPSSPLGQGGLPGVITNLYQLGFDATWEIDLFGGTRHAIEAATAEVAVAEEQRNAQLISLMGEVAQTYFQIRAAQVRLALSHTSLDAARETQHIAEAKFKTGFATEIDVARQTALTAQTAAQIPDDEAGVRLGIHALAVLLAEDGIALDAELSVAKPLAGLPSEIPLGLPSDLLRRRPDIRQAERRLAVATAQVGVATADLFPHFSLTGVFGLDSSKPKDLPKWSSHYYSISPGVYWPILDWGRARGAVKLQNESQQQAMTAYESAVAQALREVEDALVRYRGQQNKRESLQQARDAGAHAFALAQQEFRHGVVDELVVLDAQRSLLQSEDALAQSDATLRTDLVGLYKALGGGWAGG